MGLAVALHAEALADAHPGEDMDVAEDAVDSEDVHQAGEVSAPAVVAASEDGVVAEAAADTAAVEVVAVAGEATEVAEVMEAAEVAEAVVDAVVAATTDVPNTPLTIIVLINATPTPTAPPTLVLAQSSRKDPAKLTAMTTPMYTTNALRRFAPLRHASSRRITHASEEISARTITSAAFPPLPASMTCAQSKAATPQSMLEDAAAAEHKCEMTQ
jgi:hypothetical protein